MTDQYSKQAEPIGEDARPGYTPVQYLTMHARFCAAMLNARKKKLEHFTLGIVTDDEK